MAVVYIWNEQLPHSWGHASIQVDDIYISWWPTTSKSKHNLKTKKAEGIERDRLPSDYAEDRNEFMGRSADHVYNIPEDKVNPSKIKKWWKEKTKGGYHFLMNNCCDIVAQALRAGGAAIPFMLVREPRDIVNDCKALTSTNKGCIVI